MEPGVKKSIEEIKNKHSVGKREVQVKTEWHIVLAVMVVFMLVLFGVVWRRVYMRDPNINVVVIIIRRGGVHNDLSRPFANILVLIRQEFLCG